jgi:hypothetical protein
VGLSAARALLAAGLAALAGCGDCALIRQAVFVGNPDPQLQTLVDACRAHVSTPDQTCDEAGSSVPSHQSVPCGCRPLCGRVLEIIDQFQGAEDLEACSVAAGANGGVVVTVSYRPSTCP